MADTTVNPRNSFSFAEALRTAGAEVTLTTYEGVDHSEILGGLSEVARFLAPQVFADVKTFLDAYAPSAASSATRIAASTAAAFFSKTTASASPRSAMTAQTQAA